MRALLQRVDHASVTVDGASVGRIGHGLLILVCAMADDTEARAEALAIKAAKLRIFKDDTGKMNRSLIDVDGGALVVSQFTLAADTTRGNRPGFSAAAPPETGNRLYLRFVQALRDLGIEVATGQFGANMDVSLLNDGPVTIWLEN